MHTGFWDAFMEHPHTGLGIKDLAGLCRRPVHGRSWHACMPYMHSDVLLRAGP